MNPAWQTFLAGTGVKITNQRIEPQSSLADEARAGVEGFVLCDLSHLGIIQASGEDTMNFLQGQFTNDLKSVSATSSQLSAYCSPKGRVLASFRIFMHQNDYLLELPREILPTTLQRLRMFILRSKVTLTDRSDHLCRFGVSGREAHKHLQSTFGELPDSVNAVRATGEITLIHIPGPVPRYELHGEVGPLSNIWQAIASHAQVVGNQVWDTLDILSGIPSVTPVIADAFVPQMLNLHAIEGVSFKKGCYPGQEIVARTQYLGKLKRRLYRLHYAGSSALQVGDDILGEDAGQSIGKVVNTAPSAQGGMDILAVLQDTAMDSSLWLASHDRPLERCDLPYAVPEEA